MNKPDSAYELELLVRELGEHLHRAAGSSAPSLFSAGGLRGALLQRALADDALRQTLFRFKPQHRLARKQIFGPVLVVLRTTTSSRPSTSRSMPNMRSPAGWII